MPGEYNLSSFLGDSGQRLNNNVFFFFHAVQGTMQVVFSMTISKQKIVALEYKYNVMLTILHLMLII